MKCKYRVRWFSSKGALLILLWTLLVAVSCTSSLHIIVNSTAHCTSAQLKLSLSISSVLSGVVSAPLSGWLADAKFGNYKVFRVGAVVLFISTVMNCLLLILEELVWESSSVLKWIHLLLGSSLFVVSGCACYVTALPLGLDQMPDASSSSITSYIAWFVCTIFFEIFLFEVFTTFDDIDKSINLVLALISALCLGILLVSNFLLSPKWLIIEPKSPQSLKTICQVLKFATKHKAPLNRSALTYWEEDIPSRIDLGKSKYGGPFTTEQVEDVKTILRLLAMSSPFFIVTLSLFLHISGIHPDIPEMHSFTSNVANFFSHSTAVYAILATFAFEFLVYPLAKNKLPSILKRITAVPLIFTLVSLVCFFLMLACYLSYFSETTTAWIVIVLHNMMSGILLQVLLTAVLEFMCAQSPYHMRGLLVSFVLPLTVTSCIVGASVGVALKHNVCSTHVQCSLISFSVKTVTCLIGFLLFCVMARWYKMRVRDEDYSPQRVVEEVYDRYLTAAAAQSRSYGTSN